MKKILRDGEFDVVVAAAPGVTEWPSVGARVITSICAEAGLSVGAFGGDDLRVRGVIPLPGTGAVAIAEDVQGRIHRIHARAVVKLGPQPQSPDPFTGWQQPGLIPLSTAVRLFRETHVRWDPGVAILGSGNRALRFGCALLESGVPEVYCIEPNPQWGAKRFSGWEVERRRFEILGGKMIEATPVRLSLKSALRWEFRIQDSLGVRVLEVCRVVSAGPFGTRDEVREYPEGSFLFELTQSAGTTPDEDIEGWVMEEERARWLGAKIARALSSDLPSEPREELDRVYRNARSRLKRYFRHREEPFNPVYEGKWIAPGDARAIREFSGAPRIAQKIRNVASIECFEQIPCRQCQIACPTDAIFLGRVPRDPESSILNEDACTACGLCLEACPSGVPLMIEEKDSLPTARLTLPWRGIPAWKPGEFAQLLNRRGENLGTVRVVGESTSVGRPQLVQIEVPTHLAWEGRGLKRVRKENAEDEVYLAMVQRSSEGTGSKVEIAFNGEKRLVRDQIPVAAALFETGWNREGDALFCRDGSCGLCSISVDGDRKLACQTLTHRGMSIQTSNVQSDPASSVLCPCLGVTREEVEKRLLNGELGSVEAVISVSHVGEGRCHGRLCMDPFLRQLKASGIDTDSWIDWRFPWSDWSMQG
ncbi:MAG: 4Fe-4S dicluster domain-containing protein [Oligoflexia bacterium]|nr:4Fe-4S dicluster domain-containing protein [Oligoflexia bacterium]